MKLIVVKKSILTILALIVLAGAVMGVLAGVSAAANAADGKVVVIDAGHGGVDAGVLGVESKTKESDINLLIARELRNYFSDAGFRVVLTRSTNAGLYGTASKGFKMRDMKKRKQIIEDCNADMVISVHQNRCSSPSRRGGLAFYNPDSPNGKALAEQIQSCLNDLYADVKDYTALSGDYYMLRCTQSPSVLVECGFLSNKDDETLLLSEEWRKQIAYAIFKGAVSYYS